jgi:hypothetical protein
LLHLPVKAGTRVRGGKPGCGWETLFSPSLKGRGR